MYNKELYYLGLFSRAIMESGTALCIWSLSKKASEAAFAVGATLGINTTSSTDLVRALKNVSAKDLHRAAILIMGTVCSFLRLRILLLVS